MDKKAFNRHLWSLTIPIILQNLVTTSLNLLDTLMIGQVGEKELAAVGIANQYFFMFSLFIFGVAGGAGVISAQLWGSKDDEGIRRSMARTLIWAMGIAVVFTVGGLLKAESIIGLFNKDLQIVTIGSSYLRITLTSYGFTSISFVLASVLRSINNTRLPMFASVVGLVVNGLLNYAFIFGKFGMPVLGADGAAYATITARTLECLILLVAVQGTKSVLKLGATDFQKMPTPLGSALWGVTAPILLNEACWGLGNVTYMGLYAHLGTQATAAMQICTTIMNLFLVISFGLSYGALVVIGNEVGAGNEEKAILAARHIKSLSLKVGIGLMILLVLVSSNVVGHFNVSDGARDMAGGILVVFALMLPIRMVNMLMMVGILRGGGDALYGTLLQGSTLWLIGIPLTYITGFILGLPVVFVVGSAVAEEIVKLVLTHRRFLSKKWIKRVYVDDVAIPSVA